MNNGIPSDAPSSNQIARVCHEANKAYCETLQDFSQPEWLEVPEKQRMGTINRVTQILEHGAVDPAIQHARWMEDQINEGWIYGPEKDSLAKVHPCLIPYEQLPKEQQVKDTLFTNIVLSFKPFFETT